MKMATPRLRIMKRAWLLTYFLGIGLVHAAVSFHSFMGTLIPPKVTTASDAAMYRRLCRAWRRGQRTFFYPTFMCAPLDVFTGELEDHLHHVHKCWSLTVEVYPLWRTLWRYARAPA